ncbi:MAG: alpha-E domain-containing protein, partial [Planctomycetes bacterium]|nr:alpha-E domain-containing protein [Planctomycetota bacterium]
INGMWLWLTDGKARRGFRKDPLEFYGRVRREVELLRALTHGTILHDEAFHFMRLGMLLERAGQTARVLDVKHHLLGPTDPSQAESPAEAAHWLALLRTLTATESFFKRGQALSGAAVVQFLMLERDLPRSVRHCLVRAADSLAYVRQLSDGKRGASSAAALEALRTRLRNDSSVQLVAGALHDELTYMIDGIADLCDQIRADFFDPTLAEQEADGERETVQ